MSAVLFDLTGQTIGAAIGEASKDSVVLLFNPGTSNWRKAQPCRPTNNPPAIADLDQVRIAGKVVMVFHLCSRAVGLEPGDLTPKRAKEIEAAVALFLHNGIPARQIFVAGQSRGGWSALYFATAETAPDELGGVIAFAPAIYGPRPIAHSEIVAEHIARFTKSSSLDGLVFSHPNDRFFRPSEHSFVTDVDGLRLITTICSGLNAKDAHTFAYQPCSSEMANIIQSFIRRRLTS